MNRFSPETSIGMITCIAWKSELVAIGDNDGNITLWETTSKSYKVTMTELIITTGIMRRMLTDLNISNKAFTDSNGTTGLELF